MINTRRITIAISLAVIAGITLFGAWRYAQAEAKSRVDEYLKSTGEVADIEYRALTYIPVVERLTIRGVTIRPRAADLDPRIPSSIEVGDFTFSNIEIKDDLLYRGQFRWDSPEIDTLSIYEWQKRIAGSLPRGQMQDLDPLFTHMLAMGFDKFHLSNMYAVTFDPAAGSYALTSETTLEDGGSYTLNVSFENVDEYDLKRFSEVTAGIASERSIVRQQEALVSMLQIGARLISTVSLGEASIRFQDHGGFTRLVQLRNAGAWHAPGEPAPPLMSEEQREALESEIRGADLEPELRAAALDAVKALHAFLDDPSWIELRIAPSQSVPLTQLEARLKSANQVELLRFLRPTVSTGS